jgi:hypothetical protein
MTETKGAATENGLYAALAKVQAELPRVAKGKTGEVKKDGKKVYDYDYADLTDVSEAIMPLLGQNGLAFTARPTLNSAGVFVLAYSLLHSSGEREDGEYPLPSSGTPQDIGKAITYGRRYCLCAVTGVAPGGDDTDAADVPAHKMDRSRADEWEKATPAGPPRHQQSAPSADEWSTAAPGEAANGHAAQTAGGTDEAAQEIATLAHEARTVSEISTLHAQAHGDGKLNAWITDPAKGVQGRLGAYLKFRRQQLETEHKVLAELTTAGKRAGLEGEALDARVEELVGVGIEDATVAQMKEATAALANAGAPA